MPLMQRLRQMLAGSPLESGLRALGLGRPLLAFHERWMLARGREPVNAYGFHLEFLTRTKSELTRVDMVGHDERAMVERFLGCLRRGDVVYDVGANIGVMSVLAARQLERLGGGQVLAVEANRTIADTTERNLVLNSAASVRTRVIAVALGDAPGEGWLLIGGEGAEGKDRLTRQGAAGTGMIRVPIRRGDDLARETQLYPNVMKIDVEGAEFAVLRGFFGAMGMEDLRDLFVELHPGMLRPQGHSEEGIASFMRDQGFRSAWRAPRGTEVHLHFVRVR